MISDAPGSLLIDTAMDVLGCENDRQLARKLNYAQPNIGHIRGSPLRERRLKSFLSKFAAAVLKDGNAAGSILVDAAMHVLACENDRQLAKKLDYAQPNIGFIRGSPLRELRLKRFLAKFATASLREGIVPIAEFYPVHMCKSAQAAAWEFLNQNDFKNDLSLCEILDRSCGVYIFVTAQPG